MVVVRLARTIWQWCRFHLVWRFRRRRQPHELHYVSQCYLHKLWGVILLCAVGVECALARMDCVARTVCLLVLPALLARMKLTLLLEQLGDFTQALRRGFSYQWLVQSMLQLH